VTLARRPRIETTLPLAIRQKVKLSADALPPLTGTGVLAFEQRLWPRLPAGLHFRGTAKLAAKLQPFRPAQHLAPLRVIFLVSARP
jgi:hypothetical protein